MKTGWVNLYLERASMGDPHPDVWCGVLCESEEKAKAHERAVGGDFIFLRRVEINVPDADDVKGTGQ